MAVSINPGTFFIFFWVFSPPLFTSTLILHLSIPLLVTAQTVLFSLFFDLSLHSVSSLDLGFIHLSFSFWNQSLNLCDGFFCKLFVLLLIGFLDIVCCFACLILTGFSFIRFFFHALMKYETSLLLIVL